MEGDRPKNAERGGDPSEDHHRPVQFQPSEKGCNGENERKQEQKEREKEKRMQHAILDIQKKFGKNAILKGASLEEGATAVQRNQQIGGHKA